MEAKQKAAAIVRIIVIVHGTVFFIAICQLQLPLSLPMYLPIVIVIYIVIVMVNYHRQYCWNPLSPEIEQQLKMFCQSLPIIYLRFEIISKSHPCLAAYWRRLNVSAVHLVIWTQMNLLALFISFFVNYFLFGFVCSFLVTSWFPHITSVFLVVSRRVFSFATESSSTLTLTNVLASRHRSSSPGCMNSARTSNMSGGMPANQDEYGEEKGGNTCQPAQIRACRLWLGRGIHPRVRHST